VILYNGDDGIANITGSFVQFPQRHGFTARADEMMEENCVGISQSLAVVPAPAFFGNALQPQSFGSEHFNDHHFHWGYVIRAATPPSGSRGRGRRSNPRTAGATCTTGATVSRTSARTIRRTCRSSAAPRRSGRAAPYASPRTGTPARTRPAASARRTGRSSRDRWRAHELTKILSSIY